jgi:hypothetical protein
MIRAFIAILGLVLSGCATVVPVWEGRTPETLGAGGFRLSNYAGEGPLVATDAGSLLSEMEEFPIAGFRIEGGVHEKVDLSADLFVSGGSSGTGVGARYQWFGPTLWKAKAGDQALATAGRYWKTDAADYEFSSDLSPVFLYADLTGKGFDLTTSYSYRISDRFVTYGGYKYLNFKVTVDYKNQSDGPVVSSESRSFDGHGVFAGIGFSGIGNSAGFELIFEGQATQLPRTYATDKAIYTTWVLNLAVPFNFGN